MTFLIMIGIIAIEFIIAEFLHTQYGVPSFAIAIAGIFVGWGNAVLYLMLDDI